MEMTEVVRAPFPPELALAIACARWPIDDDGLRELREDIGRVRDWSGFLAWVRRHRIGPLVHRNLSESASPAVPEPVAERLRADAAENARRVLSQIAEAARLTRILAEAGISSLLIKGPLLSVIAFGDPVMRENRDIDLLVDPDLTLEADRLISGAGFRRFAPDFDLTEHQSEIYRRFRCEFGYHSSRTGVVCELHWRLGANGSLLPLETKMLQAQSRALSVGGQDFGTLPEDEMFLYLCVHGAVHVWFRLKWIADIAALLHKMDASEVARIARHARLLAVRLPFHQALILAHGLLAAPVPSEILAEAHADKAARRMAIAAHKAIAWRGSPAEPSDTPWFNTWVALQAYRLKPNLRYRWIEFLDQICAPEDWNRLPLPEWLFFLYPLLRPFSWTGRRLWRAVAKTNP
jgi:hypothetical protein